MTHTPRLKWVLAVLVAVSIAVVVPRPAEGFLKALLKPIVQTISLSIRRGRTYEQLTAQRDREIADLRERGKVSEWQATNGWLDDAALKRERDRYKAWEQGVVQRTEREKRISRDSYGRAIGITWREAAIDAVVQLPGVSSRTAAVVRGVARGEHPLRAALDGLTQSLSGGAPPPDSLTALRTQWQSTRDALRAVRLPGAESLDQRIADIITRSDRLRGGPAGIGEAAFQREIESLRQAARETNALVRSARGVIDEWTVAEARISPERFHRDTRWQAIAAEIASLQGSRAGKALVAGIARKAQARVEASIAATGVKLDDDAIEALVATVATEYVTARADARRAGRTPDIDIDALVERAVAEHLAAAGITPPEVRSAPVASATATVARASATATRANATPTVPPPTPAAQRTATPTPAAPKATPVVTVRPSTPAPTAGPPPVLTGVTFPGEVKGGGSGTTTFTWSGQLQFPARVAWLPVPGAEGCSPTLDCGFGSTPLEPPPAGNSFVANGSPFCPRVSSRQRAVYDLQIVDGHGRSPSYRITFHCVP